MQNEQSDPTPPPVLLQTEPTDAEFVRQIRAEAREACKAVLAVLDRALERDMVVQLQMGPGPTGKNILHTCNISKIFPND